MAESDTQHTGHEPPEAQLMDMLFGSAKTQLLVVAAELGIADLLKDGPKPLKALAEATGTHAPALYRALRALAGLGVFAETEHGHFTLTPLADLLRTDAPGSLRGRAKMFGMTGLNRAWADLLSSVRTRKSYFETTHGVTVFEYLQQHPAELAVFTEAMTSTSKHQAVAVCEAYDFSGFHSIVDVGGGAGFLLATILKACPALKGILFDRPEVGERARMLLRKEGLGGRCEVIDGDFFAGVPRESEAYILKYILHDWDDERAEQILTHCREAIVPGGRVLVVETVILPGNEPSPGKLLDIQMLVGTPGGRERTEAEFRTLFTRAGFELTRSVPTKSPVNVLEGVPV